MSSTEDQRVAVAMRLDFERLKTLGLEIFNRGLFQPEQGQDAASMLDRLEAIVEAAEASSGLKWAGTYWEYTNGEN